MTQTTRWKNTAKQLFVSKIEYWEVPFVGLKLALDDSHWLDDLNYPVSYFPAWKNDQFKVLEKIVCALCITRLSTCCWTPSRHLFLSVLALQRQTMHIADRLSDDEKPSWGGLCFMRACVQICLCVPWHFIWVSRLEFFLSDELNWEQEEAFGTSKCRWVCVSHPVRLLCVFIGAISHLH